MWPIGGLYNIGQQHHSNITHFSSLLSRDKCLVEGESEARTLLLVTSAVLYFSVEITAGLIHGGEVGSVEIWCSSCLSRMHQ